MDAHAIPRAVLNEAKSAKPKPQSWTDEYTMVVKPFQSSLLHSLQGPLLRKALDHLTPAAVVRSWDSTGIPRALWGDVPSAPMIEVLQSTLQGVFLT